MYININLSVKIGHKILVRSKVYKIKNNIYTIIGSFQRVPCGSTAPANLATFGAVPTDISENNDSLVIYIPCQDGGEIFFDVWGG